MKLTVDNADITLTCPGCGKQFKAKLGRLKNDPRIDCAHCHKPTQIEAAELRRGLQQAENAVTELGRSIARLGKR